MKREGRKDEKGEGRRTKKGKGVKTKMGRKEQPRKVGKYRKEGKEKREGGREEYYGREGRKYGKGKEVKDVKERERRYEGRESERRRVYIIYEYSLHSDNVALFRKYDTCYTYVNMNYSSFNTYRFAEHPRISFSSGAFVYRLPFQTCAKDCQVTIDYIYNQMFALRITEHFSHLLEFSLKK